MFLLRTNLFLTSNFFSQSVKPIWERTKDSDDHMGWVFPSSDTEEPGAEPDPLNGVRSLRELYELASTNYSGKYTVPVSFSHCCVLNLRFLLGFIMLCTSHYPPHDRFYGI